MGRAPLSLLALGAAMGSDFSYNRPAVLPGSVLDLVIDGPLSTRFSACVRITDIAWRYGSQSCLTDVEYSEWVRLYSAHLRGVLAELALDPNTSLDQEVLDGRLQPQQIQQAQLG